MLTLTSGTGEEAAAKAAVRPLLQPTLPSRHIPCGSVCLLPCNKKPERRGKKLPRSDLVKPDQCPEMGCLRFHKADFGDLGAMLLPPTQALTSRR